MELAQDELLTMPREDFKSEKSAEKGTGGELSRSEEGVAVDAYLDDDEWEREQLRAGAIPRVRPCPCYQTAGTSRVKGRSICEARVF